MMNRFYGFLILVSLTASCNKEDFNNEHAKHLVGKWRWVETEITNTYDLEYTVDTIRAGESDRCIEIEFKKNGTTKYYINGELERRYLVRSNTSLGNRLYENAEMSEPYYFISTQVNKQINCSENFQHYIPVNSPDSLYSTFGICSPKLGTSRSIYVRIE